MPDRPDPVTDRLARFTPSPAGLDRDALLFTAGRRSARGSRLWPAAAALLTLSQAVTLAALWPREPVVSPVASQAPAASVLELPPTSPPASEIWSLGSRSDVLQEPSTAAPAEFVSAGPPLTAGSIRQFD